MPLCNQSSWDGWMVSPTQWTWVWVNSGSRWWTGRPGVLQSMGSQRVRYDWATEQNWTSLAYELTLLLVIIIQQKWWDEVAEDQLCLACSPWLFLLLALMKQLLCCELPYGRACVGKSWEHLPAHSQAGQQSHERAWKQILSQLSFEMKADLASIFSNFIFLVYFLKLICYILIFIQFKFFFFFLPHSMLNPSSLIRDQNRGPCSGSSETQPLGPKVSPADILMQGHESQRTQATRPSTPHPEKLWDDVLLF